MLNKLTFLTAILLISNCLSAQTFEKVSPNIPLTNYFGYLTLADLDNDGDPEIIQTGLDGFNIFNNNNGIFEGPTAYPQYKGESQIMVHTLDVGDINRDGFIDILQSSGPNNRIFHILINEHPGFNNIAGDYLNGLAGASFLGDFEGDGDLDIIYSGADKWSNDLGGIMLNRNNKFLSGPWFPKHDTWFAAWCNLDQDSELEVVQSVGGSNYFIGNYILENNYPSMIIGKTLTVSPFIYHASFADYDADGDLDMLAKQSPNKLYKNVNGDFIDTGITFPTSKTADFGDINNDGFYDVIIGGMMTDTWQVFETGIYLNQNNGTFTKLDAKIPAYETCSAAIADIDDDGDLDIPTQNGVYKNNSTVGNAAPSAPVPSGNIVSGSSVTLTWQAATDDKTPVNSLTYNIAVRSEDGTVIVPGHSLTSGKHQIYKLGNAYNALSFQLRCLKRGTYYWKVQTLDASYQGSAFSPEQSFTITSVPPVAPVNLTAAPLSDASIELKWVDQSVTEDGFIISRKNADSEFDFYPIDTVMANETHYIDTLYLQPETSYQYQVVATNCAYPDEFISATSATTFPRAFVPSGWLSLGKNEGSMVLLGDYDNDEDLDLLLTYSGVDVTKLFRFENNGYVESGIQFPFAANDAHWIDYNNDGFMDILFVVNSSSFYVQVKLYENKNGNSFSEAVGGNIPSGTDINWQGGISLGDYDNDGDEDMLTQAATGIQIFDNDGKGRFVKNTNIVLSADLHLKSSRAWADYDRDGDLDILANKEVSCYSNILVILENNSNKTFTPVEFATLQGTNGDYWNFTGDMEWGDFDNDGYPDVIVAGQNTCGNGSGISRIYHNNGNKTFTQVASLVQLIYDVNVDLGDYDNDGDLDVFAYGDPFGAYSERTRIYKNNGTHFKETNINYLLESTQYGKAARGDIDRDGDLDLVILGEVNYTTPTITVYRSTYSESWGLQNQKPSAPESLQSTVGFDQSVTLSWGMSNDQETAAEGLTYNFYLIDETDSIITNSYSLANGSRKVATEGNVSARTNITLKNLQPGTYRWAVQSVDKGLAGSAFSEEKTFVISAITGVEDEQTGTKIYPNPVDRYLSLSALEATQFEISNTYGQHVMNILVDQEELSSHDVSHLPAGLYLITIHRKGAKIGTRKLVKK